MKTNTRIFKRPFDRNTTTLDFESLSFEFFPEQQPIVSPKSVRLIRLIVDYSYLCSLVTHGSFQALKKTRRKFSQWGLVQPWQVSSCKLNNFEWIVFTIILQQLRIHLEWKVRTLCLLWISQAISLVCL